MLAYVQIVILKLSCFFLVCAFSLSLHSLKYIDFSFIMVTYMMVFVMGSKFHPCDPNT